MTVTEAKIELRRAYIIDRQIDSKMLEAMETRSREDRGRYIQRRCRWIHSLYIYSKLHLDVGSLLLLSLKEFARSTAHGSRDN